MEKSEETNSGFDSLIYGEVLQIEEHLHPHRSSNQGNKQASTYMPPWRHHRLSAVSLALLAAALLMVDIGLGVHYINLRDTHLTREDTERIGSDLLDLQHSYKTAIDSMNDFKKQLDREMSRQTQTKWELEHETKRATDYKDNIAKMTENIASLKHHLPMTRDGCRLCPPGWIYRNSMCYYFALSQIDGTKTWEKAREFCQSHGGDLAIIDSKDKENSTVNYLLRHLQSNYNTGFWMGLRNSEVKGVWKWLDGRTLVEGYWKDGEPNNFDKDVCVGVYPKENFFKAWNDVRCDNNMMKWICDKAPDSQG